MTGKKISLDIIEKAVDPESECTSPTKTSKGIKDTFNKMTISSKKASDKRVYLDDLSDYVSQLFIIFNYRGLAAKELLLTFKENLCSQDNWYPVDIIVEESRFLYFRVGPMIFFYQNIPDEPESLVMLPIKTKVLGASSQWFTRNLLQHMQKSSFIDDSDKISFKIQKKSITRPTEKFLVNFHIG